MSLEGVFLLLIGTSVLLFALWNRFHLEKRLPDLFKSISYDILKSNQETWKGSMETLVTPLKDALTRYESVVRGLEEKRLTDFTDLRSEVRQLALAKQELQKETASLVGALRKPQVGGSWGELTLRRVVELAGMVPYCDFEEQVSVSVENGRQRPDMIIHLPSNRDIVVDAKVSLDTYLDALSVSGEEERNDRFKKHAGVMREHLRKLSNKNYWSQFEKSPEFVVMFIPGESFFSAALERDPLLLEEGMEKGVILASPATLIAILRAVAYGWRQEAMARNAVEISKLGRELHERIVKWTEHLGAVGDSLDKAAKAYNNAMGSLESRVLPSARKFAELGVADSETLGAVPLLEQSIRSMVVPEEAAEPNNKSLAG